MIPTLAPLQEFAAEEKPREKAARVAIAASWEVFIVSSRRLS